MDFLSPSAIRVNSVDIRPLDLSLFSRQAGGIDVFDVIPYRDPRALSGGVTKETAHRPEQANWVR